MFVDTRMLNQGNALLLQRDFSTFRSHCVHECVKKQIYIYVGNQKTHLIMNKLVIYKQVH